jgi:hypothetical protein
LFLVNSIQDIKGTESLDTLKEWAKENFSTNNTSKSSPSIFSGALSKPTIHSTETATTQQLQQSTEEVVQKTESEPVAESVPPPEESTADSVSTDDPLTASTTTGHPLLENFHKNSSSISTDEEDIFKPKINASEIFSERSAGPSLDELLFSQGAAEAPSKPKETIEISANSKPKEPIELASYKPRETIEISASSIPSTISFIPHSKEDTLSINPAVKQKLSSIENFFSQKLHSLTKKDSNS